MSTVPNLLYFGKLPGRGDFVRGSSHPALIHSLDHWLSAGIELLAEDAHWKSLYDQADDAHFAMISPHRHTAVAGHIMPSADLSGRRFPFLTATAIESENGADLLAMGPLLFQPAWTMLATAARRAHGADEATAPTVLGELGQAQVPALLPPAQARQHHRRYLEATTLASLTQDMHTAGAAPDLRQTLLALGLLLQPVMHSGGQPIEKGLCLPLPREATARAALASFWMDLIARFVGRGAYDFTLFLPRGVQHRPCLLVGFSAGAANVLQGLFDPRLTDSVFISLDSSPWVEEYVASDYALKKLSSYLLMPELTLSQALSSFQEAFLGG